MEESKLGVGLLGRLRLDGFLNGRVDLSVDLVVREGGDAGVDGSDLSRLGESSLDKSSDLLNMSLSINLGGFNTRLLLNGEEESDWDHVFSKLES